MKDIPAFQFILEDSPECHQSLSYWNQRSKDVSIAVNIREIWMILSTLFLNQIWVGVGANFFAFIPVSNTTGYVLVPMTIMYSDMV